MKDNLQDYLGQKRGDEVVAVLRFELVYKYSSSLSCRTSGRSRT